MLHFGDDDDVDVSCQCCKTLFHFTVHRLLNCTTVHTYAIIAPLLSSLSLMLTYAASYSHNKSLTTD